MSAMCARHFKPGLHTVDEILSQVRLQLRVHLFRHSIWLSEQRQRSRHAQGPAHHCEASVLAISTNLGDVVRLCEPDEEVGDILADALEEHLVSGVEICELLVRVLGTARVVLAVEDDNADVLFLTEWEELVKGVWDGLVRWYVSEMLEKTCCR